MEIELKKLSTERFVVPLCPCGGEVSVREWKSPSNPQLRHILLRCEECSRETPPESFIFNDSVGAINARYKATVRAITAWTNSIEPPACKKCRQSSICSELIESGEGMMRCLYFNRRKKFIKGE